MLYDAYGGQTQSASGSSLEQHQLGNLTSLSSGSIFTQLLPFQKENQELPRPLDFRRLVEDFHRKNAVVYSAIRTISRTAAEPLFQAATEDEKQVMRPDRVPDELARIIRQPNEEQECYEFMELLLIHLHIAGNAFVHKIRSSKDNVIGLELIRPDLMSIVPSTNKDGRRIAEYIVSPKHGGQKIRIRGTDVIHFKLPDPLDEWWGLSPLFVLARYGDIDSQATDFLRAYFLNKGVPSGMLTVKGRLQDDDRDQLKDSWTQQFQGKEGWHRIPVMDKDVDYKQLSTGLKDMDIGPVFDQSETRIAMVFGVPPILLGTNAGLQRSTFANFKESRRGFWTETMLPLYTRIVRRLTMKLARQDFGPKRAIIVDFTQVTGLMENKKEVRDLAIKGWDKSLFTRNQALKLLGMPPAEVNGDVVKLTTSDLYVPEVDAVDFADLTGDVITDIVQEEKKEVEGDKVRDVPNPDPVPSTPRASADPIEVWDAQTGDCLVHKRFACPVCQEELPQHPGKTCPEDLAEIFEGCVTGDQDALDFYVSLFPANFAAPLKAMVDRVVAGEVNEANGIVLLSLSIGEDLRAILVMFQVVKKLQEGGRTSQEINTALINAKRKLAELEEDK